MNAAEFVQRFGSSPSSWEKAALDAARSNDGVVDWPLVPVKIQDGGHELVVSVTSDYFAVGDSPEDALLLPLTPVTAQRIADVHGMLLPTSKIARAIYAQSDVRLDPDDRTFPLRLAPNRGADLAQYAEHNARINAQKTRAGVTVGHLVSGHKKDIVLGKPRKGKVIIYGWPLKAAQIPAADPALAVTAPWRIQPFSTVHGSDYVDYSHGVRLVSPHAVLDGRDVQLADVLESPTLASLASDEGPLPGVRYPDVPLGGAPVPYISARSSAADRGLSEVQARVLERLAQKRTGT